MNYTTNNNINITLNLVNNFDLFLEISNSKIVKPKVPKFYLAQRDTWVENPDNPQYRRAVEIYQQEKSLISLDAALFLATSVQQDIVNNERKKIKYKNKNISDKEVWIEYLYSNLSIDDISFILKYSFLTENEIYDIFNTLVMTIYRGGQEIVNARLKNAINSKIELDNITINGIQLVHPLDEYTACIESNMDWSKWQFLSNSEKATTIALFRIKRIVENHSQDEMAIEMERKRN